MDRRASSCIVFNFFVGGSSPSEMVRSIGDMARERGSERLAEPAFLWFCEKKLEITGCRILELF